MFASILHAYRSWLYPSVASIIVMVTDDYHYYSAYLYSYAYLVTLVAEMPLNSISWH